MNETALVTGIPFNHASERGAESFVRFSWDNFA